MSRSLKVSPKLIEEVKLALKRNGYPSQRAFADDVGLSLATVKNFLSGKPVDYLNFVEICGKLALDWQKIAHLDEDEEPVIYPPSNDAPQTVNASNDLLDVGRNATAAREALNPRILPRLRRLVVREKYLPAIRRGVIEEKQRVIFITAPAGYGKSTILGDIYDELIESGTGWVALVRCNDLTIEPSVTIETLATALGEGVSGKRESIVEIAKRLRTHGRGVLLIDTLDLLLNSRFVPVLRGVLLQLLDTDTTVVLTSRDQEYNNLLEPAREKLAGLKESFDRHSVPVFSQVEIREVTQDFVSNNSEINASDGGKGFADKILALAADNRSLEEITCNPLLLALLCDLFAKDGNVPPDLTVSKLYRIYWDEKVAKSRKYGENSAEVIEKEKLCITIAKAFFEMSCENLCESAYLDELVSDLNEVATSALDDLFSEGVIERLPSRKIHFFHQTLLEYAIAYWLTRRTAEAKRNQLLESLKKSHTSSNSQIHWWPVVRQLLTIETNENFDYIIKQLDTNRLEAFRAVAFAAASRDDPLALRKLILSALELGGVYQEALRLAVESASTQLAAAAWEVMLKFLQEGEEKTAVNAAQTVGGLLARWWTSRGSRFDEVLEAIGKRIIVREKDKQSKDPRSIIFGWLLLPCLPLIEQSVDLNALRALRKHYFSFGYRTCSTVIQLHLVPEVPQEEQRELLRVVVRQPIPNLQQLQQDILALLEKVLSTLVESRDLVQWGLWLKALDTEQQELPKGWDDVQGRVVGRLAADDSELLKNILQNLFTGVEKNIQCNTVAIGEAVRSGAGGFVASLLLVTPINEISPKRFFPIAAVLKENADAFAFDTQESLAKWMMPMADTYRDKVIAVFDALAYGSIFARQALVQLIPKLPPEKQAYQYTRMLRFSPIEQHPPVNELDKESQLFLVGLYRNWAKTSKPAFLKLLDAAQGVSQDVVRAALEEIETIATNYQLSIADWLPLLQSKFPKARVKALQAISQMRLQGISITDEEMTAICTALANENNQAVVIRLCELVAPWVQTNKRVPPAVAEAIGGITPRLVEQGTFEGGTARVVIAALKAIAQSEDQRLIPQQLCEWTRILLQAIDFIRVENSESEVLNLLSAVDRLDPQFLSEVVYNDCQSLPTRNIRAVVLAIRRVEGKDSPLLDYILNRDWCPQEVKSLNLEFRGA